MNNAYRTDENKPFQQHHFFAPERLVNFRVFLAWTAYPAVMSLCMGIYQSLSHYHQPAFLRLYLPVVTGLMLVLLLERVNTYQSNWHPQKREIINDCSYLFLVQIVFAQALTVLFFLMVLKIGRMENSQMGVIWPQHWPVFLQLLFMLLLAEFFRYWLHRAAHANRLLWRLHAIHHAPEKLYSLNVGRFHPLEKTLQMLFDTLPFMLLQVDYAVLQLYFVLYAINGFFQHSNIELRFGIFNFLISSAELHRWHHSERRSECNSNYGNNLIIWDLVFGTYYLPEAKRVKKLGLKAVEIPDKFRAQMLYPFKSGSGEGR